MKVVEKLWYSKNIFSILLLPFSYLYLIFYSLHRLLYRLKIKKIFYSPIPVIGVGNITVGGTGKTPFTIELSNILLREGYRPGIVSRGYKGKSKYYPRIVTMDCDPSLVGDEPALIRMKTNCPVVIAPKRSQAIRLLIEKYDCNVIILDDGLQHHALHKDFEIMLMDEARKFGNGFCLPAGPLREPLDRISRLDFLIIHGKSTDSLYSMSLKAENFYNLLDTSITWNSQLFKNKIIYAVAGIGHPKRFFTSLQSLGLQFIEKIFPDHHNYKEKDLIFCKREDLLIMTEKDAIKCKQFAKENYWVLPVSCEINTKFIEDFLKKLKR